MKDKTTPKPQKPSYQAQREPASAGAKRKAPALLAVDTTTSFTSINNTPKRMRLSPLSASATQALTIPTPTSPLLSTPSTPQTPSSSSKLSARKQRTIYDPINISIYDLRRQGLDWSVIADQTNAKCNVIGTDAEVSANGCYSRFFRNGPLIARERGEEFTKAMYLHMRGPVAGVVSGNQGEQDAGEETELDEETIEAEVMEVVGALRAEFWEKAAAVVNEKLGGEVVTAEEVEAIDARARDGEI